MSAALEAPQDARDARYTALARALARPVMADHAVTLATIRHVVNAPGLYGMSDALDRLVQINALVAAAIGEQA